MNRHNRLLWAGLLLALLFRLLLPTASRQLRDWAEAAFWPEGEAVVAAWGRSLSEEGERVAAHRPGGGR